MTFKKLFGTALALSVVAPFALAEKEEEIDASDMTRASTTAIVGLSSKGDVKLTGSLSYAFDNGQTAMTLLEGTIDEDGAYKDARLQYFHVFSFNNATTPRAAASVDIINNDTFTSVALGGIAMIRTSSDAFTMFARGAVLAGEYNNDSAQLKGAGIHLDDTGITGASAAFYAVWKTGEDGTFIAAYPELTYLNGDLEMTSLKSTLMVSTPLSSDGKTWGQVKFDRTSTNFEHKNNSLDLATEKSVWFNYKVFF
ncbi:hypothetical protein GCM10007916_36300 [Psychromonas marina]|uniref:DUF481 domain-containing protein n=1 Tax=Psychromonas marina TaxID=88364 RepID=A0ABQ6E5V3_9GAMM|nr:hypothetical protein [Psychromonas marina]GLS92558.1 hypothetical protein GCM10007916_36300 [Psychromonas marina]